MGKPPRPRPRRTGSSSPDRRDLLDAYETLVKSERDRQAAQRASRLGPPPSGGRLGLSLLIIVVCVAIIVVKPVWLFPTSLPPDPPELHDASLKLQVYRVANRIDAFRRANGRLPETAAEAGAGVPGTMYAVSGDRYTISAGIGSRQVTYHSTVPLQEFLGNSYEIIKQRSRQ
jgi:hypothetical protein